MSTNDKAVTLINGLIEINNDRIEGYEKAAKETDEFDLKDLFTDMAEDSREYRGELIAEVVGLGGSPTEGTTTSGKVYRAWMDIKAALTNKDPKAIIASCEFGEDAAKEAYDVVLKSDDLPSHAREIITKQRSSLQMAHDHIKAMRDTAHTK